MVLIAYEFIKLFVHQMIDWWLQPPLIIELKSTYITLEGEVNMIDYKARLIAIITSNPLTRRI